MQDTISLEATRSELREAFVVNSIFDLLTLKCHHELREPQEYRYQSERLTIS